MSIEEKAKAYDKAYKKVAVRFGFNIADEIFPELKKSEDEKIREEIKVVLANTDLSQFELDYTFADMLEYLEKQGEQKSADKVELKFNEGDWVVIATSDEEKVVQIDLIEYFKSGEPRYVTSEGKWFGNGTEAHLWTIQDAKDGDILHATGWHNDCIFIFSGFDNWKFDEPDGEKALATNYCYIHVYSDMIEFGIQGPDYIEVNTITPATQIQCDLLFRQMKVNGYEWDADKLALNKIEQKPVVSEDFKTSLKHIMEEAIECGDTHNLEADAEMLFRLTQKQGPAELSKKDERILKVLISHLEKHGGGIGGYECSFLSDWLKSLKEKVQLKQEWSEKDKEMIQAICTLIKDAEDENKWNCVYLNTSKEVKFLEIRDWLDSLIKT